MNRHIGIVGMSRHRVREDNDEFVVSGRGGNCAYTEGHQQVA
jgi:hypothetical protein